MWLWHDIPALCVAGRLLGAAEVVKAAKPTSVGGRGAAKPPYFTATTPPSDPRCLFVCFHRTLRERSGKFWQVLAHHRYRIAVFWQPSRRWIPWRAPSLTPAEPEP